jgi:hypothetical protein
MYMRYMRNVDFEVFTVVRMKVFWVLVSCILICSVRNDW